MANERRLIELIEQAGDMALAKHISLTSEMIAEYLVKNGVEIPVHCKNCRYCRPINRKDSWESIFIEECVWCIEQQTGKLPDDYCSDGEKREVE